MPASRKYDGETRARAVRMYRDRLRHCRVLTEHGMQIAPSTYYAAVKTRVSAAELADAYLVAAVVDLYRVNRSVYGVRKLWREMRRTGHDVGRDQVARLMKIAGIAGVVRGEHTTTTTRRGDEGVPRHPDLLDRAWDTPTRPDQWCVASAAAGLRPARSRPLGAGPGERPDPLPTGRTPPATWSPARRLRL